MTLYDSGNNRLEVGGDTLTVTLTPSQESIEIFDNQDGSYLIKYRITVAGTFAIEVQTNLDSA